MRRKVTGTLILIALVGAFTTYTVATVSANTALPEGPRSHLVRPAPSPAEAQAAAWGVTINWVDELTCGQPTPGYITVGCYKGGSEIFVLNGAPDTELAIWHELGHFISKRDGLGWGEAECDAYAEQMTR